MSFRSVREMTDNGRDLDALRRYHHTLRLIAPWEHRSSWPIQQGYFRLWLTIIEPQEKEEEHGDPG